MTNEKDLNEAEVTQEKAPAEAPVKEPYTSNTIVGYWHYGVIVTYLSVIFAIISIYFSVLVKPGIAIVFLMCSGLCDMFDGVVARTRKNRTKGDKIFGAQIDTLSDLLAFGVAPAMLGFAMGMHEWYFVALLCAYILCALIRLSFFNVLEVQALDNGSARSKYFAGVPVTQISTIAPIFYLIATMFTSALVVKILMAVMYILYGSLMVIRIRIPKPGIKFLIVMNLVFFSVITSLFLVRWFVCGVHTL